MLSPLFIVASTLWAGGDSPLTLDRTGIRWRVPFGEALAVARREHRLLFVKPVAFGTTPDGCW